MHKLWNVVVNMNLAQEIDAKFMQEKGLRTWKRGEMIQTCEFGFGDKFIFH